MTGKILSSRDDEGNFVDELAGLVFYANELAGVDEDPKEDEYELMMQLDDALDLLHEKIEVDRTHIAMLSMDLIQQSLRTTIVLQDLASASKVLEALAATPNTGNALTKAIGAMQREASTSATAYAGHAHVQYVFTPDSLESALISAIQEYIHETAVSVMS